MSEDNQVHTRSLHAEENAFLQLAKYGGDGIEGGNLYTTASPCELCAKKAFQLGIKNIFYIDPYPGISLEHILKSGAKSSRPVVELFQGAVGQAYHRLYDPVLPYKDELKALIEGGETVGAPLAIAVGNQLF
jgi:tRNA(Arg) A34 adenosine deaminase TadA